MKIFKNYANDRLGCILIVKKVGNIIYLYVIGIISNFIICLHMYNNITEKWCNYYKFKLVAKKEVLLVF